MSFLEWLQMVGAITTILSLPIALYSLWRIQKELQASSINNIAKGERELWLSSISDENMAVLMAKHFNLDEEFLQQENITASNALRLLLFFRQYENIYYQYKNHMLSNKMWEHWLGSMLYTFQDKRVQTIFSRVHVGYSKDFKDFVKKAFKEQSYNLHG